MGLPPWASIAFHVLAAAGLGLPFGLLVDPQAGWAVFATGLIAQIAYHARQYRRLEWWSHAPSPARELEGEGLWYEPFARIWRHERELRREIDRQKAELERFAAAGQALTDGLVALNGDNCIEWCNRSAEDYLGLNQLADRGQPITNLVRQPAFVAYMANADFDQPLRLRAERASDVTLSIRVVTYGADRRLLQIRDISQFERTDQMRRDLVANVSHELRTPLTVLSGFLETLREIELSAEERDHYLTLMHEQSVRMTNIVQDLLTLSSLESAPAPSPGEPIDAARLMEKLLRDAQGLSGGRHTVRLDQSGQGDLLGAELEIASAFGNLVSNAIRYTPTGGAVTLSWRVGPQGAEFAVEDSGIGIEPQHLPRLTERFYRVDQGRSRDVGGTGLGLAIVKHALNRHQAQLDIQSQPGKGSRFAVRFPAQRVVAVPASTAGPADSRQ